MSHTTCGLMPPHNGEFWQRSNRVIGEDECLRPFGHLDANHVFRLMNGTYVIWETDWNCGCEESECTDCFTFRVISPEEAYPLLLDGNLGE